MRQTGATKHPSAALQQTIKNRFLSPVTRVFRKRFLTTCLTTDSRGVCGNSVVKSCEEHPQQSKSGYKAPEKVEKFLFKSLGAGCREFGSPISDQNVLMKDAAQKTPRKSAVFSHIYQFFRCKKLENEIFQRHDLRARAVRVEAEH